jgi:hypothetical protein
MEKLRDESSPEEIVRINECIQKLHECIENDCTEKEKRLFRLDIT